MVIKADTPRRRRDLLKTVTLGIPVVTSDIGSCSITWRSKVFQKILEFKYAYYGIRIEQFKLLHFHDELNAWDFKILIMIRTTFITDTMMHLIKKLSHL